MLYSRSIGWRLHDRGREGLTLNQEFYRILSGGDRLRRKSPGLLPLLCVSTGKRNRSIMVEEKILDQRLTSTSYSSPINRRMLSVTGPSRLSFIWHFRTFTANIKSGMRFGFLSHSETSFLSRLLYFSARISRARPMGENFISAAIRKRISSQGPFLDSFTRCW